MSGERLSPDVRARVLPILREAIDATEQLDGEIRSAERAQVGTYLRQLGLADQFGHYGAAEVQALYDAEEPEWLAKLGRLAEVEAETQNRLRAGDVVGAQETYEPAYDLRFELFKDFGGGDFVDWLIEIGDLDSALKVVDLSVGQIADWNATWHVRKKARILLHAGRRAEAVDFLAQQGAEAKAAGDSDLLFVVAHTLVAAKAQKQARAILRSAATRALAAVSGAVHRPLAGQHDDGVSFIQDATPVSIAQFQCEIGDAEGAVTTLKSVLKLEPPPVTKEERQRRRGPTIWTLPAGAHETAVVPTPDALAELATERWERAVPELVRALARAGLESDVESLLASQPDQRSSLLAHVIKGSTERGAFAAAFKTIQSRQDMLEPAERDGSFLQDLSEVTGIAARLGDVEAFRRAISMRRERFPDERGSGLYSLYCGDLAGAGKVDVALEFARLTEARRRPGEFLYIVRRITGVPLYTPWDPHIRYFAS